MPAIGLTVVASALLLAAAGAAQASPPSDHGTAAPKASTAAAAAHAAPPAKAAPRVIDPPIGDPVGSGSPLAPIKVQPAPAPRPPSLADVVERIDRILREGASTTLPGRSSVRPARDNGRKAATSRGPAGQPAGRHAGRDITLVWPGPRSQRSTGVPLHWPADLDPRRQPSRPLGVRLSWPSSADSR